MLLAIVALAALPDLIPARWVSNNPATLDVVAMTPVNCLLLEPAVWSREFNDLAARRGIATMALIHPAPQPAPLAPKLAEFHFTGAVLEGVFAPAERQRLLKALSDAKLPAIELTLRSDMKFDGSSPVIGTYQGVWPGIQIEEDGKAKAAPSGAAWIDTNTGFLRFARAAANTAVWIANQPPKGQAYGAGRYIQVIGDAAMAGARWVLSFDAGFTANLLAGDQRTLEGWRQIGKVLEYYESHKDWREAQPFARLALVEDTDSGALLSGGILDMIATKHTPVRPVPKDRLDSSSLAASQMAVNVDPDALTASQKEVLRAYTRAGGTLLTGPPGWKFPMPQKGQITLEKDDLKKLDDIWRELNSMTGRKNLGARLFNVSSMLSNVLEIPARREVIVHLVNYSDFPVENVTVHVLGSYKSAVLEQPDGPNVTVTGYEVEEGSGYDIDQVKSVATLVLTR
jgi:hypothetical protein